MNSIGERYEKCHKLLYGHTGNIYSVSLDKENQPYSGSNDNTVRCFDLEQNYCSKIYMGHGISLFYFLHISYF